MLDSISDQVKSVHGAEKKRHHHVSLEDEHDEAVGGRLPCEVAQAPSGPATWFMPAAGVDANSGSFITSETSGLKLRHRKAMTVKNLAYFFNSGNPDTVTVHSRKNGANGNLTCSIASQSNALGQDTSHSDSLAVRDDFCFAG